MPKRTITAYLSDEQIEYLEENYPSRSEGIQELVDRDRSQEAEA